MVGNLNRSTTYGYARLDRKLLAVSRLLALAPLLAFAAITTPQVAVVEGAVPRPQAKPAIRIQRSYRIGNLRLLWCRAGDGKVLISSGGLIGSLSLATGRIKRLFGVPWPTAIGVRSTVPTCRAQLFAGPAAASPDGGRIVALRLWIPAKSAGPGRFGAWQVWSVAGRKRLGSLSPRHFPSGSEAIPPRGPLRVIFADRGKKLVGFGRDGLYFFNARTLLPVPQRFASSDEHIVALQQSQERRSRLFAAVCMLPGRVEIWNAARETRVVIIVPPPNYSWHNPALEVSLGGGRCAVAWGRNVALYDATNGALLAQRTFRGYHCEGLAMSQGGGRLALWLGRPASGHLPQQPKAARTRGTLNVLSTKENLKTIAKSGAREVPVAGRVRILWYGKYELICAAGRRVILWSVAVPDGGRGIR